MEATKEISERVARAAAEVDGSIKWIEAVSIEAEKKRVLTGKVSDASTKLSPEVNNFGEEVSLEIDATSGQKRQFQRFPVDLLATVAGEDEFVRDCPIRELSLGVVAIELEGGPQNDGMEVKITVEKITPIVGNLVRKKEPIACVKCVEPDIEAAAEM